MNDNLNVINEYIDTDKKIHIRHFGYVRALGLLLVLLYHFYPKIFTGGFIGVDIFFVFSGYLITALALEEYRKTRNFNVKKFTERRFFRIFPTIFFVMLVILPITLFGNSDLRYSLSSQVFSGLGFITNIYEASTGISYANNFAPHLFVHLWSLAIEVQFYIIWGIVISLLSKRLKKRMSILIFAVSASFFLISNIFMFIGGITTNVYSPLYYNSIAHSFPFFLGAMLASIAGIKSSPLILNLSEKYSIKYVKIASIVFSLLLMIFGLTFQFNSKFTYLFGFTFSSVITLLLILSLRLLHEKSDRHEPKVIKYIADVSYGVYVFHWPFLISFLNFKMNHDLAVFLTIVLSFSFATFMYFIIDPVLRGKRQFCITIRHVSFVGLSVLLVLSIIALFKTSNQTILAKDLWVGSNQQAIEQLKINEEALKTGKAGADTLIIGDSVTLGTTIKYEGALKVQDIIPTAFVDASGDRTISEAFSDKLEQDLKLLPENATIVFALGTNSVDVDKDIDNLNAFINNYSKTNKIVLVTPANWGSGGPFNSDKIADYELTLKNKNKNLKIADWRGLSKGHTDWFDVDGIHIGDRTDGRKAWINLVKKTIDE